MKGDDSLNRPMRFISVFLAIYFLLGVSTYFFQKADAKNFPPLFHWFLFNRVPNEQGMRHYTAQIVSRDERVYSSPIFFVAAGANVTDPKSNRARDLLQKIGRAIESQDELSSQQLIAIFEAAYILPGTRYEIVAVDYKPIERFLHGDIESVHILATREKPL
jgi:hypothetical protein